MSRSRFLSPQEQWLWINTANHLLSIHLKTFMSPGILLKYSTAKRGRKHPRHRRLRHERVDTPILLIKRQTSIDLPAHLSDLVISCCSWKIQAITFNCISHSGRDAEEWLSSSPLTDCSAISRDVFVPRALADGCFWAVWNGRGLFNISLSVWTSSRTSNDCRVFFVIFVAVFLRRHTSVTVGLKVFSSRLLLKKQVSHV